MRPTKNASISGSIRCVLGRQRRTRGQALALGVVAVAVLAINLLQACSFRGHGQVIQTPDDVYDALDSSVYVSPEESQRWSVIDDDLFKVEHGYSCARANQAATTDHLGLRIIENVELAPSFDGTVFLNGWLLEYKGTDHHVVGLGTSIFNIVQLGNQLVWNAGGVIGDKGGEVGYRWCYSYTVLSWKRPASGPIVPIFQEHVDIAAIVSDPHAKLMYVDGSQSASDTLHVFPASFKTTGKAPSGRLLAGFGNTFADTDHHILQLGFDMKLPKIKRKKIKWQSEMVFKDNSDRAYRGAEIVSVLQGDSVHMWHPANVTLQSGDGTPGVYANEVDLVPRSPSTCPGTAYPSEKFTSYAITGVPYTWAIPMLTGWDIGDPCDDNHVKYASAQIEDWHYARNPGDVFGTLYYTVSTRFADQDHKPGMVDRVKVDVLGVDPILPPGKDPGTLGAETASVDVDSDGIEVVEP